MADTLASSLALFSRSSLVRSARISAILTSISSSVSPGSIPGSSTRSGPARPPSPPPPSPPSPWLPEVPSPPTASPSSPSSRMAPPPSPSLPPAPAPEEEPPGPPPPGGAPDAPASAPLPLLLPAPPAVPMPVPEPEPEPDPEPPPDEPGAAPLPAPSGPPAPPPPSASGLGGGGGGGAGLRGPMVPLGPGSATSMGLIPLGRSLVVTEASAAMERVRERSGDFPRGSFPSDSSSRSRSESSEPSPPPRLSWLLLPTRGSPPAPIPPRREMARFRSAMILARVGGPSFLGTRREGGEHEQGDSGDDGAGRPDVDQNNLNTTGRDGPGSRHKARGEAI